jgi:hypothetical protein
MSFQIYAFLTLAEKNVNASFDEEKWRWRYRKIN